ncbi:unnamed protein product [Arabidopsis thaliana]|uniref:(thale cress) hypothetical protein n=1 Tax=Arabidopsis thaliana TaxID=3702 RepID=A0A7G2FLN5_ARATH|nr:unnamed protein product [Arabidopsis thaliana]
MKTVTGRVVSAEPISLSKAAKLLSGFASSDNGASQDVSAYLRRASAAFTELKSFHREIKSKETKPSSDRETKSTETKQSSDAKSERNVIDEFDGRKIRYRNSEAVSVESVYGRERDEKKMKKSKDADVVDEKLKALESLVLERIGRFLYQGRRISTSCSTQLVRVHMILDRPTLSHVKFSRTPKI